MGAGALILRVPGDKSIAQRAMILGALAHGESVIRGEMGGADTESTRCALGALGVHSSRSASGDSLRIRGRGIGGLKAPESPLHLGNSGTGARLLMGAVAAMETPTVFTGDRSLSGRPMDRVADPLVRMGASVDYLEARGRLPLAISGGRLESLVYPMPVASAQVKSALLLAGLCSGASVVVAEPYRSRDHTERMLADMGAALSSTEESDCWRVDFSRPPARLDPLAMEVPGDFSSAAFLLAWALLQDRGGPWTLSNVGLNPTRTGLLRVLDRMGAVIHRDNETSVGGEPVGDLIVESGHRLHATDVSAAEIPGLIDELPVLAIVATRSEGVTSVSGAAELRVKESDRIGALVGNLERLKVEVTERQDGFEILGTDLALEATVPAFGDHRIAMAFGVLGSSPRATIRIDDATPAAVSFPGFWEIMAELEISAGGSAGPGPRGRKGCFVVTIDGPAGSGKSTTAHGVAQRLGFRHLDSGALYRGITYALLEDGAYSVDSGEGPPLDALRRDQVDALKVESRWDGLSQEIWIGGSRVPDASLRVPAVTAAVSAVSAVRAVRSWLLDVQRASAEGPGLVADGRDMGSVVFPEADLKVFLKADARVRALRRLLQMGVEAPTTEQISEEEGRLVVRDAADSERELSPLQVPTGAVIIDTTELDLGEQISEIVSRIHRIR